MITGKFPQKHTILRKRANIPIKYQAKPRSLDLHFLCTKTPTTTNSNSITIFITPKLYNPPNPNSNTNNLHTLTSHAHRTNTLITILLIIINSIRRVSHSVRTPNTITNIQHQNNPSIKPRTDVPIN